MSLCLIGLGSNIGERAAILHRAVELLAAEPSFRIQACSGFHHTRPIGGPTGQGEFLNAAIRCETSLTPHELLETVQRIENQLGRTHDVRWGPRAIDIDLLLYDALVICSPALELPHPRMGYRHFVLAPATEVGAAMIHPPTQWSVRELLDRLSSVPNYVAVSGGNFQRRSEIARTAAAALSAGFVTDPVPSMEDQIDGSTIRQPTVSLAVGHHATQQSSVLKNVHELMRIRQIALKVAASAELRPTSQFVLSDFWIAESLALATLEGSLPLHAVESLAGSISPALLSPKLLVFVENDPNVPHDGAIEGRQEYDTALKQLAARPQQCPVLNLRSNAEITHVDEIIAAVRAMQ